MLSVNIASGSWVSGREWALSDLLVSESACVLEGVPHVAEVGWVVVVGEGLRAGARLDCAVSADLRELKGDVVDVLLDGGCASHPEVGGFLLIYEGVHTLANVTSLELSQHGLHGGVDCWALLRGIGHLNCAVGVEGIERGELGDVGGNTKDGEGCNKGLEHFGDFFKFNIIILKIVRLV
jgi:hypothetical protein